MIRIRIAITACIDKWLRESQLYFMCGGHPQPASNFENVVFYYNNNVLIVSNNTDIDTIDYPDCTNAYLE